MEKTINFRGADLYYTDRGSGECIVLVHGYLETGAIFSSFAGELEKDYRLIVPDLPGHGKSGCMSRVHLMEDLADAIAAILEVEDIDRVVMAGHSMGGYVTMAFTELFPGKLRAFSLFHSTCFPDTEKKRVDRDREISLVRCGRLRQIVLLNIPRAFAEANLEAFASEVDKAQQIALENSKEGVEALLRGMKERPDRSEVLSASALPALLVGGAFDNYIPSEVYRKLFSLAPGARTLMLEKSGHMGFIEEGRKVMDALRDLINSTS